MARPKKTTEQSPTTAPRLVTGILKSPRVTEKAANANQANAYVFDVAVGITKSEIAKAFIAQYNIKPLKVNVVNKKAQAVYKRNKLGFTNREKKAYVFLPKGKTIEII